MEQPALYTVQVDQPILVDGQPPQGENIALPTQLANLLLHAKLVKRTDGVPLDREFPNAKEITDTATGRIYSLDEKGRAVITTLPSKIPLDSAGHAQLERDSWSSMLQQVGAIRSEQKVQIEKQFSDWSQQHDKVLSELTSEVKSKKDDLEKEVMEIQRLRAEAAAGAEQLQELQSMKAGELVAKGYQDQSKVERRKILIWQGLSLLAIVVWVLVMWFRGNMIGLVDGVFSAERFSWFLTNVDWPGMLLFVGGNIPFAVLLSFCLFQVKRHQDLDRIFTRLGLELTAIDSYIRPIPEPERSKIKASFAERFFSGGGQEPGAAKGIESGRK